MRRMSVSAGLSALLLGSGAGAQDSFSHQVRFVAVEENVRLEILDWGGTGRPLVLLAGLAGTAHDLDEFASKLSATYHVYAVTRRGFGRSSSPTHGYDADELGNDVLAVIDSLGIRRPILAGHSMAGQELSSIGSRQPEKVSGLIYLDAGQDYAFYDDSYRHVTIDINEIIRQLDMLRFGSGASPQEKRRLMTALADTSLPAFLMGVRALLREPPPPSNAKGQPRLDRVAYAIFSGQRKYTAIKGPVLAIFASPLEGPAGARNDPAMREMIAEVDSATEKQVRAFERGVPQARVVRIPHASHFVFQSHETEVLREIHRFIQSLPKSPN